MDFDSIPLYRRLTFKFLLSTVLFILLVEGILFYFSLQGMTHRLVDIRGTVLETIPPVSQKVESMILPDRQIDQLVWNYGRNITLMVGSIVVVVVVGMYFVVRYWFISPIQTAIESNRASREGSIRMIPESAIPDDELGVLMRSRNQMLEAIQNLYSQDALETLCNAVDAKDQYTEGHSRRVGLLGAALGRRLNLDESTCDRIQYSGTLHDIGKIGVPDDILNKPGALTDEEFEQIQEHPARGENMIQFSNISEEVKGGIRHHHEEYDGSGYPDGLEGEDIPLFGRILAAADAMDAMLSNRSYRDALAVDVVREELKENEGKQFDPEAARAGVELLEESQSKNQDFLEEYLPSLR